MTKKIKNTISMIVDVMNKVRAQNISTYASSIAFFFFLSIVPMLIVICAIMPYTPLTEGDLVELATEMIPLKVQPLVVSLISDIYERTKTLMTIAALATIWSAAKGVMALMRGLNAVNHVEEKRNYFVIRAIACFYTVVMLIVVILSLFLNVFGRPIIRLVLYKLPNYKEVMSLAMNFRFIFVWFLLTMFFAAIYTYVPNASLRFKEQIPGAIFVALVWSVFTWGFSIYVDYGNTYGIYGSLSIIIIILIWLYFSMYIIMIGSLLNSYFKT